MVRSATDGNPDDPSYWAALGLPGTIIEAVEIAPSPPLFTILPDSHAVIDERAAFTFTAPHSGRALVSLTAAFVFYTTAQPIVGWWDTDADAEIGRRRTLGGGSHEGADLVGATSTVRWVLELEAERTYNLALAGSSATAACYLVADDGIELGVGPLLVVVTALAPHQ